MYQKTRQIALELHYKITKSHCTIVNLALLHIAPCVIVCYVKLAIDRTKTVWFSKHRLNLDPFLMLLEKRWSNDCFLSNRNVGKCSFNQPMQSITRRTDQCILAAKESPLSKYTSTVLSILPFTLLVWVRWSVHVFFISPLANRNKNNPSMASFRAFRTFESATA